VGAHREDGATAKGGFRSVRWRFLDGGMLLLKVEGEVGTCGTEESKRSEPRHKNGWRAEEGWSSPKGSNGYGGGSDPVAPGSGFRQWSGPTAVGSSVGGCGVLHLEGETCVRERGRKGGGHDGDRCFKMAGVTVREEGGGGGGGGAGTAWCHTVGGGSGPRPDW
jgi:hypothetical protein